MKKITYIVLILLLMIMAGCGDRVEVNPPEIPAEPEITGLIFSVIDGRILVVSGIEHVQMPYSDWFEKGYRAIWFSIENDTEILFADGRAASFVDLEEGQQVDAWSSGAIMESYPEQTGAKQIVIIKGVPDSGTPLR